MRTVTTVWTLPFDVAGVFATDIQCHPQRILGIGSERRARDRES
jgi:hypothetical protein